MVLCDRMGADPTKPKKVNLFGLINAIAVTDDATFPMRLREMTVYLALTGGRGTGSAQIVIVDADSGRPVIVSEPQTITFGTNPLATVRLLVSHVELPLPCCGAL